MSTSVIEILGIGFTVISLLVFSIWAIGAALNPSPEKIVEGTKLIVENEIPWYIGFIQWAASNLPSTITAILILLLALGGAFKR